MGDERDQSGGVAVDTPSTPDAGDLEKEDLLDLVEVDLSRQQVFSHLATLQERGVLDREQDPDDGRRLVWLDDGLHRLGEHGDVDLGIVDDVARELDLDSQRAIGIATVVELVERGRRAVLTRESWRCHNRSHPEASHRVRPCQAGRSLPTGQPVVRY